MSGRLGKGNGLGCACLVSRWWPNGVTRPPSCIRGCDIRNGDGEMAKRWSRTASGTGHSCLNGENGEGQGRCPEGWP